MVTITFIDFKVDPENDSSRLNRNINVCPSCYMTFTPEDQKFYEALKIKIFWEMTGCQLVRRLLHWDTFARYSPVSSLAAFKFAFSNNKSEQIAGY